LSIGSTLTAARLRLEAAGIDDAALEAEVLLRHALGLTRAELLARLGDEIDQAPGCMFDELLERRLHHEPTAYITGVREFFGLEFEVTPATLIPRPESELLVEAAIEVAKPRGRIRRGPVIADVGTGSGAVAIALALNVARSDVYGIDVSGDALAVAARNAERLGATRLLLYRGHLLTPMPEFADVIVANLPYVTTTDWQALPPEIREHEPRAALDGGDDGLDVIRELLAEAPRFLRPRGCVCIEFGAGQTEAVKDAARTCFPGYALQVRKDLAGIDRVLVISPQN
jgi:release factor glutamine methyltransferase